jgi:PTS system mannose-specific IIC component
MIVELAPMTLILLLIWGMLVGLDLVSVPQLLLARPIVAGAVAGLIVGDPATGFRVGILMELFALDVLPIGAVRYPDYGPATIAATVLASGMPWQLGLGLAGALALLLGALGGWTLKLLRHANARDVQRHSAALRAGESGAIRRLQWAGIGRDALRALALTAIGLVAAVGLPIVYHPGRATAMSLTLVRLGGGAAAAIGGAGRAAGQGIRLRWLAAGLVSGTLWAVLR